MSKLRQIPGLVYHPEEGRLEVTAATQEEREKCISIFQQIYQQIVNNRQLKSHSIKIVSMSFRQYDQAKKPIKEKLSGKLPTSSATSIAFPALSTGVYAVKGEIAALAIFEAICKFNYTSDTL